MIELLRTPFRKRSMAELLYALIGLPVAAPGFVFVVVALPASFLLVPVAVGLPMFVLTMRFGRGLGAMCRGVGRGLLGLKVAAPPPARRRRGFFRPFGTAMTDSTGWRAILYLFVRGPLAALTFVLTVLFWAYGVVLFTFPLWHLLPFARHADVIGSPNSTSFLLGTVPSVLATTVVGLVVLLCAPWVVRVTVVLDRLLIIGLLGATTLSERVRDLEQQRAQAAADAAARLRQIERDLHDGTQARLVSLALKIGLAKEELNGVDGEVNLAAARVAIEAAHQSAKQALTEVRDLARGIHPAVLDRGLDAALATLAARSPVPVALTVDLDLRPSPAVEQIAYYCVAELLTNVAKHSGARQAEVAVGRLGDRVRLRVSDDGDGGARRDGGTGLNGLADRVRSVDGSIAVQSPAGGPTVIEIDMPARV